MDGIAVTTARVVVAPESWQRLWPEAEPLMLAHRRELKQEDERAPLVPDQARIIALQEVGGLFVLAARREKELVGYSIWYLMPSLETVGLLLALQAPWYVKPEFRSLGVGGRLWRLAELQLRQRGVRKLVGHLPKEGPAAELIVGLERRGATILGTEFELWLEPN